MLVVDFLGTFNANGATIEHSGTGIIISGDNPTTSAMTLSCSVTTTAEGESCSITTPDISRDNYTAVGWGAAANSTSSSYDKAASMTLSSTNTGKTYYAITKPTDTTACTIAATDFCIKLGESLTNEDLLNKATITDASGIKTKSVSPTTFTASSEGTQSITYTATDNYGNSCSKTVTATVYKQIRDDITVVTSGDGLYEDAFESGRYVYRGADPNNYLTFNGQTWRILSIESDGTYKIIYTGTDIQQQYHSSYSSIDTFNTMSISTYLNETYFNALSSTAQNLVVGHSFNAGTVSADRTATGYYLSDIVDDEGATPITINVGLQTLSDYLMASATAKCYTSSTAINSLYAGCKSDNWMNITTSTAQYTMINRTTSRVWHVQTDGSLSYAGDLWNATTVGVIRPVVYLSAATTVTGSGTSSDPYVINDACSGASSTTCTISTTSGYTDVQTLTIKASNTTGTTYSFDGTSYSSTNTKSVSAAGTYVAFIKDSSGLTNSCSVTLNSRTEYRSASCAVDLTFGSWYTSSTSYTSSCSVYYQNEAEADNATWYRAKGSDWLASGYCTGGGIGNLSDVVSSQTTCSNACNGYNNAMGALCANQYGGTISCSCSQACITYGRSCSCSSWGSFGSWGTTEISSSCGVKVESRTAYGV